MPTLDSPVTVGPMALSHRVVLAPLTRMRAEAGATHGLLMQQYYAQRATSGGLLITEATIVADNGNGCLGAPGMYNDGYVEGWRGIVDAVHARGAKIFLQLYHAGRQSHVDVQPGGAQPVGPSAVTHSGLAYTASGWVACTPNRALTEDEIAALVVQFRKAARRGMVAGFDGIELHAANGHLFDQFLQDNSNRRADRYGGSFENRARFLIDTARAIIADWNSTRVAVRLGPSGRFGDTGDSNSDALFTYLAGALARLDLAYLYLIEPRVMGNIVDGARDPRPLGAELMRRHYPGLLMVASGFEPASAEAILQAGDADLVAFGRHFIANPDLPVRTRNGWPLAAHDRDTFYCGTPRAIPTIHASNRHARRGPFTLNKKPIGSNKLEFPALRTHHSPVRL